MEPSMVAPYFGTEEKPECHILYNVTTMASIWNTYATRDVRLLRKQIDKVSKLPPNCVFLNYLRCHDDIGWGLDYDFLRGLGMHEIPHKKFLNDYFTGRFNGSTARGELYNEDQISQDARLCGTAASLCGIEAALWDKDDKALSVAIDADIMLHAFMFSLSGIPVIYSGDEVGQLNDYTYHDDVNKKFDSRYLHRGKFDRKLAKRRNDPDSYQGRIFNSLKKLGEARGKNRAFKQWAKISTFDTGSDNVLGFFRTYKEQNLLALFNFCNEERTVEFDMNLSYTDLLTGTKHTKQQITLGSYGFVWALTE